MSPLVEKSLRHARRVEEDELALATQLLVLRTSTNASFDQEAVNAETESALRLQPPDASIALTPRFQRALLYVGRAMREVQLPTLITGSTGLDDWEWGVTLMAKEVASVKQIVYEMRFDEVSARYGGFGEFYINLRLKPEDLWEHLGL